MKAVSIVLALLLGALTLRGSSLDLLAEAVLLLRLSVSGGEEELESVADRTLDWAPAAVGSDGSAAGLIDSVSLFFHLFRSSSCRLRFFSSFYVSAWMGEEEFMADQMRDWEAADDCDEAVAGLLKMITMMVTRRRLALIVAVE
eukprot:scaffold5776_cov53-Attheya_sp.AAC.4